MKSASGIIPACLTPISANGEPNVPLLVEHCGRMLDEGCTGILLLGTTGEGNSFTAAERRSIVEGVLLGGVAAEKLIVGTGCCAVPDTVGLTKHALSLGVKRVLVLPPFYYKNVTDQGLFDAFASVIEGVDDDRLRLFLYLIPQMTGIEIGADLVERLHGAFPTLVAGLKDSSGNWAATEVLCRRLGPKIDVMVGTEALLMRAMDAGASGCITATANVAGRPIVHLFNELGDPSASVDERAVTARRMVFENFPMIPALKAYLAETSGDESWGNVRPPLLPLARDATIDLLQRLQAVTSSPQSPKAE